MWHSGWPCWTKSCSWNRKDAITRCSICYRFYECTPKFAVSSHQDVSPTACFWHSLKENNLVLKDQVWMWASLHPQNKKRVCLQTSAWELQWKSMLNNRLLHLVQNHSQLKWRTFNLFHRNVSSMAVYCSALTVTVCPFLSSEKLVPTIP
jgi:hypothetical protein